MELDEFKSAWAQYDKKLSRSLMLNEELLRKMNLNNAKRELHKPLVAELIGIVSMFAMVVGLAIMTVRNDHEPKYIIPGIISIIIAIIYFSFAIIKARGFMSIDHYGDSIVKLQRDVAKLNQLVLRLRKYEVILAPFATISFPVIFKALYNVDLYSKVGSFGLVLLLCAAFSIPATLWVNKHIYDKKFQSAGKFLKEINDFEADRTS
jgi:hypothetical protein